MGVSTVKMRGCYYGENPFIHLTVPGFGTGPCCTQPVYWKKARHTMRRGYWTPHAPSCFIYKLIGNVDLLYKHQTIKQLQTHGLEGHSIAFYRVRIPCYTYKVINEEKPRPRGKSPPMASRARPIYKNLQIKQQQLGNQSAMPGQVETDSTFLVFELDLQQ